MAVSKYTVLINAALIAIFLAGLGGSAYGLAKTDHDKGTDLYKLSLSGFIISSTLSVVFIASFVYYYMVYSGFELQSAWTSTVKAPLYTPAPLKPKSFFESLTSF